MTNCSSFLRRFRRSEDGTATIEFALTFPAIMLVFMSSVELGMATFNHSMLERAVDMTVRDIRLGTGTAPQHDEMKNLICERAAFITECDKNLKLEMVQVDPRNWIGIDVEADCTDLSEEVAPVRNFDNGKENELMILRACAKINPVFPTTGIGKQIEKDGAGQYALISTSAFVQEPK